MLTREEIAEKVVRALESEFGEGDQAIMIVIPEDGAEAVAASSMSTTETITRLYQALDVFKAILAREISESN